MCKNDINHMELNDIIQEQPQKISPTFPLLFMVTIMIVGSVLGSGMVYLLELAYGLKLQEVTSGQTENSAAVRDFLRWSSLWSHFCTFTIPVLITVWVLERPQWVGYLHLNQKPKWKNILVGLLFIMFTFPIAQFAYWVNQQIPLPYWVSEMEDSADGFLALLLSMPSIKDMLFNLLVIAVIPALGEELVFRGMLQKRLSEVTKKPWIPIWVAAFLFSAFHLQFAGFLPRLILGASLGYLFYWTNNLWVPILAHLFINGIQVIITFINGEKELSNDPLTASDFWPAVIILAFLIWYAGAYLRETNTQSILQARNNNESRIQ